MRSRVAKVARMFASHQCGPEIYLFGVHSSCLEVYFIILTEFHQAVLINASEIFHSKSYNLSKERKIPFNNTPIE